MWWLFPRNMGIIPRKNTEHQTGGQGSYFLPKTWNCCIVATCAHKLKSVVAKKWDEKKMGCQKVVCSDQTKIPLSKHGWRTSECPDKKIGWYCIKLSSLWGLDGMSCEKPGKTWLGLSVLRSLLGQGEKLGVAWHYHIDCTVSLCWI